MSEVFKPLWIPFWWPGLGGRAHPRRPRTPVLPQSPHPPLPSGKPPPTSSPALLVCPSNTRSLVGVWCCSVFIFESRYYSKVQNTCTGRVFNLHVGLVVRSGVDCYFTFNTFILHNNEASEFKFCPQSLAECILRYHIEHVGQETILFKGPDEVRLAVEHLQSQVHPNLPEANK